MDLRLMVPASLAVTLDTMDLLCTTIEQGYNKHIACNVTVLVMNVLVRNLINANLAHQASILAYLIEIYS